MKKNILATLSLTVSFLALGSGPILTMQADKSIDVKQLPANQAGVEIRQITAALAQAAADDRNPHKQAATNALRHIGTSIASARAALFEYNKSIHVQKGVGAEIQKKTEELQRENVQLTQRLEEAEKKVQQGMNPEKMREIADRLLAGVTSLTDLLFLYPFMIGTAENALVEPGLARTKLSIQNVEDQNSAYQEDRKKAALSTLLKMPEIDAKLDRSPLLNELASLIGAASKDLNAFKQVVIDQKSDKSIAPLFLDFIESESVPTPTGRSYRYLERMLQDYMAIFSGPPPYDPLSVNNVFNKYKAHVPSLYKYILGIDASLADTNKAQTKMLSNIIKVPAIKALATNLSRSLGALSMVINKSQPGGKFTSTEDTLNALAANELMKRLQGKNPQQFHQDLQKNIDFFKQSEEEVGFEKGVVDDFKKNAETKEKFAGEIWFSRNFKTLHGYGVVEKLRLTGKSKEEKDNAEYAVKDNIDRILREKINAIIDALFVKFEGKLNDPALKNEAQLALADNFENDFTLAINDLIDRKIKDKLKKEQDNPILKITHAIYNAQYAHAQLIEKLKKLRVAVGNNLDKVDPTQGPVEARAVELRNLCQQFEGPLNYIALDSEARATHYVLVLGALASPAAWQKLGVDIAVSHPIIEALISARKAYFAARDAIEKIEELVPATRTRSPHYWLGFEMNATPLALFDPMGGAMAHGAPPPPPGAHGAPPPPPGAGAATPAQMIAKVKAKLPEKVYDQVRRDFLDEVRDNWKKLDYEPSFNRFLEICRRLHNAEPGATQYANLATFKTYLNT